MTAPALHDVRSKTVRIEHYDGRPPAEYTFRSNPRHLPPHDPDWYLHAAEYFCLAMNHPNAGNKVEILK